MVRRSEPAPPSTGPIRTCVGCRAKASDSELLRVVARDEIVVPDPRRGLPGRGAWLHPDPACLRAAERRRAFPRALRVQGALDLAVLTAHLESVTAGDVPPREAPAADE
ncbi:YlxR family protein [Kutzneria chonburiensis]|uniref:YlxR family protein n=1 Tax=Kutzneria chonburiensis TaxID=1483604 RepID=UPI00235ECD75|nr:YlxR family protein [Kutzneria chonburiensis]